MRKIEDPSNEEWYVAQYAHEDNDISWHDVGNLTEAEQQSLIYYLLSTVENVSSQVTLQEIILYKPELLEFYRKDLFLDLAIIEVLESERVYNWWNLAKGASDSEVDILLHHFDKGTMQEQVFLLLLGADSDYALSEAAKRAKDSSSLRESARDLHVLMREDGTFERRFVPDLYQLLVIKNSTKKEAYPEGITLLTESQKAVSGGKVPTCTNEALVVLSANLAKIEPFKQTQLATLGKYHFFSANCEDCDAWLFSTVFTVHPQTPWEFVGTYNDGSIKASNFYGDDFELDCDPESTKSLNENLPDELLYLPASLLNNREIERERVSTLGGRSKWVQWPEIPNCPDCGKMMFYIGQNQASQWSGRIGDQVVFAFACEECLKAIEIVQFT